MNDLINEYIFLAIEHGKTKLSGEYKTGNKIHGKLTKIIDKIRNADPTVREHFYALMDNENAYVRIWTASTLLNTFRDEALRTLKEIASKPGVPALEAKAIIGALEQGMLNFIIDWNK